MKTYYEKNFANGVLNNQNTVAGSNSGRHGKGGMADLFVPV